MSGRGRRAPIRRPSPAPVRYPWLVPVIVVIAVLIVVAGVVWAASIGELFTIPSATPSPSAP